MISSIQDIKTAEEFRQALDDVSPLADVVEYTIAMHAAGQLGDADTALVLFSSMQVCSFVGCRLI